MEEIIAVLREYVLRELLPGEDPGELTGSTPLVTGGILDSLATLKLVAFLEDRFGITIEAHETGVDYMNTVADLAQLVAKKRGG